MKLSEIEIKNAKQKNGKTKEIQIVRNADFRITGYEFPEMEIKTEDDFWDCNWLNDEVVYQNKTFSYSGILTAELEDLIKGINKVLLGKENRYQLIPMEPGVRFIVEKFENKYKFAMMFYVDFKEQKITQILSKKDLQEKNRELKEFLKLYPIRK